MEKFFFSLLCANSYRPGDRKLWSCPRQSISRSRTRGSSGHRPRAPWSFLLLQRDPQGISLPRISIVSMAQRTLLKAQAFLKQAQDRLERAALPNPICSPCSVRLLTPCSRPQATGRKVPTMRGIADRSSPAELEFCTKQVEQLLVSLPSRGNSQPADHCCPSSGLAEEFGTAELEHWGTPRSSLNSELVLHGTASAVHCGNHLHLRGHHAILARSLQRTRQTESALRNAKRDTEAIQQTTLDAATIGIVHPNMDDPEHPRVIAANRQMATILGISLDQLVGTSLTRFYADLSSFQASIAELRKVLASGKYCAARNCYADTTGVSSGVPFRPKPSTRPMPPGDSVRCSRTSASRSAPKKNSNRPSATPKAPTEPRANFSRI